MNALDRFSDLQRQGFMKFDKPARPKKAKAELPIVACDECCNWHRLGKHTATAVERKARRRP